MASTTSAVQRDLPVVQRIEAERAWEWLRRGALDLRAAPAVGLTYGALAAVTGYVLAASILLSGMIYLLLPLMAGFLIVGPLLTVGLYEVSRRRELGQTTSLREALGAWLRNGSQIALMGMALLLLMFAWVRLAALLFLLWFGMDPPSVEDLLVQTFLSTEGLPFLFIGTASGGLLALVTFSISVVAIPLLLDRPEANVIDAVLTSIAAVRTNPWPLLFWAALIVLFIAAGLATLFLGLIVALPLIGHASWHAYTDLVHHEAGAAARRAMPTTSMGNDR
ncbi:DUF2189 domain-containing protein [Geminicoccaceae bacterium 1502E]|nr:DUF2189 domain-containing protein [Geminicoccaceae bacterium 1502E]